MLLLCQGAEVQQLLPSPSLGWSSRGSAAPNVPYAPGQPVLRSFQELEEMLSSACCLRPLWGCFQPVPQAFPRSAACQALQRAPVISCQRPWWGFSELQSPYLEQRLLARAACTESPCQGQESLPAQLLQGSLLSCQPSSYSTCPLVTSPGSTPHPHPALG